MQRVKGAKNGRMAETLGNAASVERVDGFRRGVVADVDRLHENSLMYQGLNE
jgi:hypothetical protein